MKDILERLAESSPNEGSHDLQCRCFDAAEEISRLRAERDELLKAIQNVKDVKGRHHTEQAMLALFRLLGKES